MQVRGCTEIQGQGVETDIAGQNSKMFACAWGRSNTLGVASIGQSVTQVTGQIGTRRPIVQGQREWGECSGREKGGGCMSGMHLLVLVGCPGLVHLIVVSRE